MKIVLSMAGAVLAVLGFVGVSVAHADTVTGTSTQTINGVPVNVCAFSSTADIVSYVNANKVSTLPTTVLSDVLNVIGGLSAYQHANCTVTGGHIPHVYNSCDSYWANGLYGIRRGSPWYNVQLDTQNTGTICQTPVQVTGNANCTAYQTTDTTYGTQLNDAITEYNRLYDLYKDQTLTDAQRIALQNALDRVTSLRTTYNSNATLLKVNCNQSNSGVTIINQSPAISTNNTSVTAPASSGSSVSGYPVGSAKTGEW